MMSGRVSFILMIPRAGVQRLLSVFYLVKGAFGCYWPHEIAMLQL
jgi:hypothetical protein